MRLQNPNEEKGDDYPKQPRVPFPASGDLMWEYCQRKVGQFRSKKPTTMGPWQEGKRGAMKAYGWMVRTSHLMNSGIMENVRKIAV